jgi:hypothetical protein
MQGTAGEDDVELLSQAKCAEVCLKYLDGDSLLALTLIRNPSDGSPRILPVTKWLIAERKLRSVQVLREGAMQALGGGRGSRSAARPPLPAEPDPIRWTGSVRR